MGQHILLVKLRVVIYDKDGKAEQIKTILMTNMMYDKLRLSHYAHMWLLGRQRTAKVKMKILVRTTLYIVMQRHGDWLWVGVWVGVILFKGIHMTVLWGPKLIHLDANMQSCDGRQWLPRLPMFMLPVQGMTSGTHKSHGCKLQSKQCYMHGKITLLERDCLLTI